MSRWLHSDSETRRKAGLQPLLPLDDRRMQRRFNPRMAALLKELRRGIEVKTMTTSTHKEEK